MVMMSVSVSFKKSFSKYFLLREEKLQHTQIRTEFAHWLIGSVTMYDPSPGGWLPSRRNPL